MTDETRRELKMLAASSGERMGDFLASVLKALHARLDRIRGEAQIPAPLHGEVLRGILALDTGRITEGEFKEYLTDLRRYATEDGFEFATWGI
jgi:hypothetical protein